VVRAAPIDRGLIAEVIGQMIQARQARDEAQPAAPIHGAKHGVREAHSIDQRHHRAAFDQKLGQRFSRAAMSGPGFGVKDQDAR
jgi:hypothetical protein